MLSLFRKSLWAFFPQGTVFSKLFIGKLKSEIQVFPLCSCGHCYPQRLSSAPSLCRHRAPCRATQDPGLALGFRASSVTLRALHSVTRAARVGAHPLVFLMEPRPAPALARGPPCGLTTTPKPSSVLQHARLGCQRVEDGEEDGPWAVLRPSAPSCVKKPWAVWTGDGGIETEAWPPRKGVEQ